MNNYKTQNLYEASFLLCCGFNFTGKERSGSKVFVIFEDSEDIIEAVKSFYAGGKVSGKAYSDWYRTLKDYVFSS